MNTVSIAAEIGEAIEFTYMKAAYNSKSLLSEHYQ